jgi:magnesium transporter
LAILPVSDANALIKLLDAKKNQQVQMILEDKDQKNIDFATSKFIKFPPETEVEDVISHLRTVAAGKDVIMYIYIVDQNDKLLGVVDLREMLKAKPNEKLGDIMINHVQSLNAASTLLEASEMFKHYGFRAIPITDDSNRILGVITYRDVVNLKHLLIID